MTSNAKNPEDYIENLPENRKAPFKKLRNVILDNLPKGFEEQMTYGMVGYVVPKSIYPKGYHVKPELPLGFISIASQKNFIGLYHMGIYANKELLDWFVQNYPKHVKTKLNMGKSCIRFKKMDDIPYGLIGKLVSKITIDQWITHYENQLNQ